MKKIAMGAAGVVVGLIAALTLPSFGQSSPAATGSSAHTVTVTGTATIKTQPDEAVVSLGVQTQASSAEAALQQNAAKMNHVLAVLSGLGIGGSDLATSDVSLYPSTGPNGTVTGYQASNSVDVTVHDLSKVGSVIDKAVGAGANLSGGITFQVSDQNKGMNGALAAAVQDSKSKAVALAAAGGAQLGSVVSIDATRQSPQPPVNYAYAGAAGAASTPVRPPTLQTQVSVTVVWALS
jgi:uncharacterized protein YggE